MKISFSTLACPSWSISAAIEQARILGYDGIELSAIKGMCEHLDLDHWRDQADTIRALAAENGIAAHDPEGVVQELVAMIGREDTTEVVRTLPCPFLAIAGALDQGTAAESKKLVELAPDGELVIIPGANHLVSFQRPDLVNPVLLRFLERCTA